MWIELKENGEFHNVYSEPCGNDSMLETHNYSGKWSVIESKGTLNTTKPIMLVGKQFKIANLQQDSITLTVKHNL